MMVFTNLKDLTVSVIAHEQFQHDVKSKRIKKELLSLADYHNPYVVFKQYEISVYGVSLYVMLFIFRSR